MAQPLRAIEPAPETNDNSPSTDIVVAEAAAARAADIEHRSKVMGAAKVAIMGMGVGEQAAITIVRAIAAGDVPAVSIRF